MTDAHEAIGQDVYLQVLKSKELPLTEKQIALNYIVHLVGDLHQPLHVGFLDDLGVSTINHLLEFAGAHTNSRFIDVYDSTKKVWAKKSIWGNLFATEKDGPIVLFSNGRRLESSDSIRCRM